MFLFDVCLVPYIRDSLQMIYTGILLSDPTFMQIFFSWPVFLAVYRFLGHVGTLSTSNGQGSGNAAIILETTFWHKHCLFCSWKTYVNIQFMLGGGIYQSFLFYILYILYYCFGVFGGHKEIRKMSNVNTARKVDSKIRINIS